MASVAFGDAQFESAHYNPPLETRARAATVRAHLESPSESNRASYRNHVVSRSPVSGP